MARNTRSQRSVLSTGAPSMAPSQRQGEALGVTSSMKASKVDNFVVQHGALTQAVLNPQQFHKDAEYRLRKTMHVGGSTSIRYNLTGQFTVSTSIGPRARASTGQRGRTRISRSIPGGYYSRMVRSS